MRILTVAVAALIAVAVVALVFGSQEPPSASLEPVPLANSPERADVGVPKPDAAAVTAVPAGPALSSAQRQEIDALVADLVAADLKLLESACEVEKLIDELFSKTGCSPAMKLAWCAHRHRELGRPLPKQIDEAVIDAILARIPGGASVDDWNERAECARALSFLSARKGVPAIIAALTEKPPRPNWTSIAWHGINYLPDERFIAVIDATEFTDQSAALSAISMLRKLGRPALPSLERFAQDEDEALRGSALEAIADLDWERAKELLAKLPQDDWKLNGIRAAGEIEAKRRADRLCVPLELPDEDAERLRYLARLAFDRDAGAEKSRRAEELMVELGEKSLAQLRNYAVSYGHTDGSRGARFYIAEQAAGMLERIGKPAVGCLIEGLHATHAAGHLGKALNAITGQQLEPSYDVWREWWMKSGLRGR